MQLKELLEVIDYTEIINRSGIDVNTTDIKNVSSYSDNATENCVFVCIMGSVVDGHEFAINAYSKGCRVFIAQKPLDNIPNDSFIIIVKDSRKALAQLSAAFFDYPANKMTLIGITGTKGKTTTSTLTYKMLCAGGVDCELMGNMGLPVLDYIEEMKEDKEISINSMKYYRKLYNHRQLLDSKL